MLDRAGAKCLSRLMGRLTSLLPGFLSLAIASQAQVTLSPTRDKTSVQLWWPSAVTNAAGAVAHPEFELQYKGDLGQPWNAYGGKLQGIECRSGARLSRIVPQAGANALFFRVLVNNDAPAKAGLVQGAEQVFGYGTVFSNQLARIGQLSVDEFATNASHAPYLSQITWDPTTARFWTNFQSPAYCRIDYGSVGADRETVYYNFQLDGTELPMFLTNGFVVSERLGSPTFGDAYYRLFQADLPVFVTSDSILHAWYMSFVTLLQEIEEMLLSRALERLIVSSVTRLKEFEHEHGDGCLRNSIEDADYILTVARSLLSGKQESLVVGTANDAVARTLTHVYEGAPQIETIFGSSREIDFSLLKPRGH